MKAVVYVSSIVVLLGFSEAHGHPQGQIVSGFQCVGINIPGLHLSQDDLRTGEKFPWMLTRQGMTENQLAECPA